jgi:tRNA A-37 threonylcarbamoyl transferase component Bud32
MRAPGGLIAAGRDADIFEYGPGLVLRQSRQGRSMADEARIMEYVRARGYPVPAVEGVSDDGLRLVMQSIEGLNMVDTLMRRPWAVRHYGRLLADLHHALHRLAGPSWLGASPIAAGDRVVHLDLHPLNVIMSATGPVVIDWTNAKRGDAAADLAMTWILLEAGSVPSNRVMGALVRPLRRMLIDAFLGSFDVAAVVPGLRRVVEWKVHDPNMSADEQAAMWRLVAARGG